MISRRLPFVRLRPAAQSLRATGREAGLSLLAVLLLLAGAAPAVVGGAAAAGDGYVEGLEDVPLMPGLESIADAGMVFDDPSGRIVEAYAEGRVERSEVLAFYAATLPQLGWRAEGEAIYRREGEVLRLEFIGGAGMLAVHFFLSPG